MAVRPPSGRVDASRAVRILKSVVFVSFPTCSLTLSYQPRFEDSPAHGAIWSSTEQFVSGGCCFYFYSLITRSQDEGQPASHLLGGDCLPRGGTRRRTLDTLGNFRQPVII